MRLDHKVYQGKKMSKIIRKRSLENKDFFQCRRKDFTPGNHNQEETPVPIPNTEVKFLSADGTAQVTEWESRSLPGFFLYKDAIFYIPRR